jgi:UDP-N-acetylglucosamine transferase subunit ALG13
MAGTDERAARCPVPGDGVREAVILVTTGTNGVAFDRLLRAVDAIETDERVVVQHGPSSLRPSRATCFDYVSFEELVELVRQARLVVSHGGVGSILVALTNGKRPLVVPRLARFGEVVDDHQLELARKLAGVGLVTLEEDVDRLPELVLSTDSRLSARSETPSTDLAADLRGYLAAILGPSRTRLNGDRGSRPVSQPGLGSAYEQGLSGGKSVKP